MSPSVVETVDWQARATADSAKQAIESHEKHCGERWGEARKAMEATNASLIEGFKAASESARRLHARIDKIVWAVALGACALLANAAVLLIKGL